MGVGIFVLGLIAALGFFSMYQNSRKNAIIKKVIQDFLDAHNGLLVSVEKPTNSGPFHDEYYDEKEEGLYQNLGYQPNETVYRQVSFQTADGLNKRAWLQLRIENLTATYIEWKE